LAYLFEGGDIMTKRSRIAALILSLVLLPSCQSLAGSHLVEGESEADHMARPPYRTFNAALEREYIGVAQRKVEDADYEHVDLFVRKSLAAASGKIVLPEKPEDWMLLEISADEFGAARRKLLRALEGGARIKAPHDAAHAQVMYDCWIDQRDLTNKTKLADDIDACREDFWSALALIEMAIAPEPELEPGPKPPETLTRIYLVYSD
jgi:OmpA-OmpF porin, OOP family